MNVGPLSNGDHSYSRSMGKPPKRSNQWHWEDSRNSMAASRNKLCGTYEVIGGLRFVVSTKADDEEEESSSEPCKPTS